LTGTSTFSPPGAVTVGTSTGSLPVGGGVGVVAVVVVGVSPVVVTAGVSLA
jgi:hypothetical protein